ncbi:MAG: hypothetical protein QW134_01010 [Nitrososphaeria archaeon]
MKEKFYRPLTYFLEALGPTFVLQANIDYPIKVLLLYVLLLLASFLINLTPFSKRLAKRVVFFLAVVYRIFSAILGPIAGKALAAYIVIVTLFVLLKKPKKPNYLKEPLLLFVSILSIPLKFLFPFYLLISYIFSYYEEQDHKNQKKCNAPI